VKGRGGRARSVVAGILPWLLAAAVGVVWLHGRQWGGGAYGERAGESFVDFARQMALVLPPVFVLIGLFEVWVPRELVARLAGKRAGLAAIPWMVLLATLQAGPLYVAFPVAVSLWRKGCTPRNVFIYLGAFSALKIPMLTFEVTFLGWQFSLARTAITLPVFILLAALLEWMLPAGYRPPALETDQVEEEGGPTGRGP